MEPGLSQPVHGLIVRGGVPGGQSAWREGERGEDHGAPPSHPYCTCARPLGCPLHPGTWGRGGHSLVAPREGLYPRPWSCTTSENLSISGVQEGWKGWALRSLQVSEPDLKVTGWRSGGRRGCFGIPRTSVSSGVPESLPPPSSFSFLFFSFFHPPVPSLILSFPFCLTPFVHVYFS